MRRGAGFTLIELVLVVVVVGLLAAIGTPNLQRALIKSRAATTIGSLQTVRLAVYSYMEDHATFPPDASRGVVPPELVPYLPAGYSFEADDYSIDYDNWTTSPGFVGLTVITDDAAVGYAMIEMLGTNAWTNGLKKFTWVIQWND